MKALTRAQVRSLDSIAVERYGIPGIVLMENAGRGATDFLIERFPAVSKGPVVVVAGRGNNGGDGFVIARQLTNRGTEARIALLGEPARFRGTGEAGVNFEIVEKMGIPLLPALSAGALSAIAEDAVLLVDALLGTGLSGEVRGAYADAIGVLNESAVPVFAVDIPSGLDCDSGLPLGVAVRAEATATFAAMKTGLLERSARVYAGDIRVVDIGCPLDWE
jgi:NAD(P)H-hydrate epimerase